MVLAVSSCAIACWYEDMYLFCALVLVTSVLVADVFTQRIEKSGREPREILRVTILSAVYSLAATIASVVVLLVAGRYLLTVVFGVFSAATALACGVQVLVASGKATALSNSPKGRG